MGGWSWEFEWGKTGKAIVMLEFDWYYRSDTHAPVCVCVVLATIFTLQPKRDCVIEFKMLDQSLSDDEMTTWSSVNTQWRLHQAELKGES